MAKRFVDISNEVRALRLQLQNLTHVCDMNVRRCGELQRDVDALRKPHPAA